MRVAALLVLVSGTGCNLLFSLDEVHERIDAAPVADIDAESCGMFDEDGDTVFDDCDGCPGMSDPSQPDDGDHDQVNNACDPSQATQHELRHFSGFSDPADIDAWTMFGTTWTAGSGEVDHADVNSDARLQYLDVDSSTDVTVEVGMRFTAWKNTTTNGPRIGVWLDSSSTALDGHTCWVSPYGGVAPDTDTLSISDAVSGGSSAPITPPLNPGEQLVIAMRRVRSPDVLTCRLLVNGVQVATTSYTAPMPWPPDGRAGINVDSASASLRYVAVYAAP